MYIYLDENNYVTGYGSEYEPRSIEVLSIPGEVVQYLGAYKYDLDTNTYTPDQSKINYLVTNHERNTEIDQLMAWFEWYDQQCAQYLRAQRLGLAFDKDIEELDEQARTNAQRISELRELVAVPYVEEIEG